MNAGAALKTQEDETLRLAAVAALSEGRYAAAAEGFLQLAARHPTDLPAWLGAAAARMADRREIEADIREAVNALAKSRELMPEEATVFALMAMQESRFATAIQALDAVEQAFDRTAPLARLRATALAAGGDRDGAIAVLQTWCDTWPADSDSLSQLSDYLRDAGAFASARDCAERASRPAGDTAVLLYRLGLARRDAGDSEGALDAFRRLLQQDPDDRLGAAHHIALLEGSIPQALAASTVRATYDEFALFYDRKMVDRLHYRGPQLIREFLENERRDGFAAPWAVLDLGCGTGLIGAALADVKRRLDGIDLSPRMLEQAHRRAIYDDLHEGDLLDGLAALASRRYDVAVAAEVFIHIGDLAPVLAALRPVLQPQARVVFNTNLADNNEGEIVPRPPKYFAHSPAYLQRVASDTGFRLMQCVPCTVRLEQQDRLPSLIVVLSPEQ